MDEADTMGNRFLCRECRCVFDMRIAEESPEGTPVHCQMCDSADVIEAPAWAPLGSGSNIFDSDVWKYKCQQCDSTFTLPIPRSPTEGEARTCPFCDGRHLHLLTAAGALPLYCG
jgi:DNA-directed RNA polymerase subunit RPC12/RpoP